MEEDHIEDHNKAGFGAEDVIVEPYSIKLGSFSPALNIDLAKLRHNVRAACDLCRSHGIGVAAVTKVFCGDSQMVAAVQSQPVEYLADSRLLNISQEYPAVRLPRILLRAPAPGEAGKVVAGSDISLNSELATIQALGATAEQLATRHGIILMVDMGDLREGLHHKNEEEILRASQYTAAHQWLDFLGVGVNLTCYGAVLPDSGIMERFAEKAGWLQNKLGMKFRIVSGGNSSAIDLLEKGGMPAAVNNLRLGEFIVRGEETAYQTPRDYMEKDVVTLEARLIEVQEKPSMPEGDIGLNAFGEKIHFEDRGIRRRGILNVGRQDVDHTGATCLTAGVEIIGASSDHLIVDLSDSGYTHQAGEPLHFSLSYSAMLRAFTSPYVSRKYSGCPEA